MSSSCLNGGGRTYGFDRELVKSPSTSLRTSHSSSPSSTLSESSNSPIAISTRKARTPRKRPNQTYNEAAALLSTAYPSVFSPKHLTNPCKFTKHQDPFFQDSTELLLPLPFRLIDGPGCLLHQPILDKPDFRTESTKAADFGEKPRWSPPESSSHENCSLTGDGYPEEDFDAESILDEEIEAGIDSIMGNLSVNNDTVKEYDASGCSTGGSKNWYGGAMDLSVVGWRLGMRRALRHADDGDWWRFSPVDILQISPKLGKPPAEKKKKKKKTKVEKAAEDDSSGAKPKSAAGSESWVPKSSPGLLLKLNYEDVAKAWADRGSPLPDGIPGCESPGSDGAHARAAQEELFPEAAEEGGGGERREASVLRYKEKRRTRLFSKKIRYQVRKVNADRRPRMKGRFVRRGNGSCASPPPGDDSR